MSDSSCARTFAASISLFVCGRCDVVVLVDIGVVVVVAVLEGIDVESAVLGGLWNELVVLVTDVRVLGTGRVYAGGERGEIGGDLGWTEGMEVRKDGA